MGKVMMMKKRVTKRAVTKVQAAVVVAVIVIAAIAGVAYYMMQPPPLVTVRGLYEKLPPTDVYADAMKEIEWVNFIPEGTSYPDLQEKMRIALSTKSPTYDFFMTFDGGLGELTANGWAADITDYVNKYWDEYNLDDIPEWIWDGVKVDGRIYGVPYMINTQMFFYRSDLFEENGFEVPKTIEEWYEIAEALTVPEKDQYGYALALKDWDVTHSEYSYFVHALGGTFFDENWVPIFNNDIGVQALEWLVKFSKLAQPGYMVAGNDEKMVAFQQGLTATGIHWATRCRGMDDPEASKVVDLIGFDLAPIGGQKRSVDCWFVSAFSEHIEETVHTLLEGTKAETQRKVVEFGLVARKSVLDEASTTYRHIQAAMANFEKGAFQEKIPEIFQIFEKLREEVAKAVVGDKTAKQALDDAAQWAYDLLKEAGYY